MKTTKLVFLIVLSILLAPIALLEYFSLFWFWCGDGVYMIIAVPVYFIAFFLPQLFLFARNKENQILRTVLIYTMIFLTPVLAVCGAYLMAWICGIRINIM